MKMRIGQNGRELVVFGALILSSVMWLTIQANKNLRERRNRGCCCGGHLLYTHTHFVCIYICIRMCTKEIMFIYLYECLYSLSINS